VFYYRNVNANCCIISKYLKNYSGIFTIIIDYDRLYGDLTQYWYRLINTIDAIS